MGAQFYGPINMGAQFYLFVNDAFFFMNDAFGI